jgi:hypothetical protein
MSSLPRANRGREREKSKARGPGAEGKRQKPAYKQAGAKANSVGNWDGGFAQKVLQVQYRVQRDN